MGWGQGQGLSEQLLARLHHLVRELGVPLARLRALAAEPLLLVLRLLHGGAQLGRAVGARLLALVEGSELGLG